MKKVLYSLIIVSMVIGFTAIVGCGKQEANQAGQTLESLQLGELQAHTFEDKGFSVSYPSHWVEVNTSSEGGIWLRCDDLCSDKPLVLGIMRPLSNTSFTDSQMYIEFLISVHTQIVGSPLVSKETIAIDGKTAVKAVYESSSSEDEDERWLDVDIYWVSDNGDKVAVALSGCYLGCWEYYKDAVYAITASYQFLD